MSGHRKEVGIRMTGPERPDDNFQDQSVGLTELAVRGGFFMLANLTSISFKVLDILVGSTLGCLRPVTYELDGCLIQQGIAHSLHCFLVRLHTRLKRPLIIRTCACLVISFFQKRQYYDIIK